MIHFVLQLLAMTSRKDHQGSNITSTTEDIDSLQLTRCIEKWKVLMSGVQLKRTLFVKGELNAKSNLFLFESIGTVD